MMGFIIWAVVGAVLIIIGICDLFSRRPVGFWANAETSKVNDVKGYNRATGILFIIYGIIFIVLGIPLLSEQKKTFMLLSVFGVMFETIIIMAVYTLCIEKKYTAKNHRSQSKSLEAISFDRENQTAVIKCSICNGEQVAGFKNKKDGHFTEVMLIKSEKDLEYFKEMYQIDEISKEY